MKISLDWLGDYVNWKVKDPDEIARVLTARVAEVETVEKQGELLGHCCIGQVLTVERHPDADKLVLCDVQTDKGKKRVVCGGTNLRVGMRVVLAHVGATVRWHGEEMMTLQKTKIRGQESEGMICAAEEVGLADMFPEATGHSIIDLGDGPDSAKATSGRDEGVGQDARAWLGLNDTVLHIDNHAITHRPDLFSHVGFARECVALGLGTWKNLDFARSDKWFKKPTFTKAPLPFKFALKDKKLMPRYCACLLSIDNLGKTPDWMKRRLEVTGWRSINLPIDVTNYVMMEIGVPLHSFDAGDIRGTVTMRQANKGEKITTLDGQERALSEGALILADDEGIFDLIGIMGGQRSSTKPTTRSIYLHSASLDPVPVRNAMIAMGHRTEAGTTYEKGVPPVVAEQGFYRAAQLMLELVPGAKIVSVMDDSGTNGKPKAITLSLANCNAVLGTDLKAPRVKKILADLGFKVTGTTDPSARSARSGQVRPVILKVTPPLWRLGDIGGAHDLIEEVGRVHGYDAIKAVMPRADATPPPRDERLHGVRDGLREDAFVELVPFSILGSDLLRKAGFDPARTLEVANPLGEELSRLQPSTLPRLLEHAAAQLRQADHILRTFTVADVFTPGDEHREFGAVVAATGKTGLPDDPFLLLKSSLQAAFRRAGSPLAVHPTKDHPAASHPGRVGEIRAGNTVVGHLFEIHPSVRARFGLPHRAAAALIGLDALFALPPEPVIYQSLPQFPAVTYDETMPMRQDREVAALMAKMKAASALLESVEVADLYQSSPDGLCPAGATDSSETYNLTLRFTYRSPERTLTETEVKTEHGKVTAILRM